MTFLNVKHQFITAYLCQANGAAKNFYCYIKTVLGCNSNSGNWFEHLDSAMLEIIASYNQDIQMNRAEKLCRKTSKFSMGRSRLDQGRIRSEPKNNLKL